MDTILTYLPILLLLMGASFLSGLMLCAHNRVRLGSILVCAPLMIAALAAVIL